MKVMRILTGISLLVLTVLVVGCGSDPAQPSGSDENLVSTPFPWEKSGGSAQGHLYVTARSVGGSTVYTSGGYVFSSPALTPPAVDGGTATVSNLSISYDPNGNYFSVNQPAFGTNSSWGLSGSSTTGISPFTDNMYVPSIVTMISPIPSSSTTISKSSGVTVQWNVDPNNDSVIVGFKYDVSTSQFVDPTLPFLDYTWYVRVPDNGSFNISASAFSTLPVGGYVDLVVTRGNSKMSGSSVQDVYIYGYTVASGLFEIAN